MNDFELPRGLFKKTEKNMEVLIDFCMKLWYYTLVEQVDSMTIMQKEKGTGE